MIASVAVVTMNNPPVNALGPVFLDEFRQVLAKLEKNDSVRALLLASECPGFFSAGDDIDGLKNIDENTIALLPAIHAFLNTFEALPFPTVAAINGHALGGGLELALTCDFRFMAKGSGRIGLPEVRLGMIPALGGTQRLVQTIGKAKAIEMMYKGLQLTAQEAKQFHLITDIYPQAELNAKSLEYAQRLARQATGAIAGIKKSVLTGLNQGFEKGFLMEQRAVQENIFSADAKEGVAAFLEGRKPDFKGV